MDYNLITTTVSFSNAQTAEVDISYPWHGNNIVPYIFITLGPGYYAAAGDDLNIIVIRRGESSSTIRVFSTKTCTRDIPIMVLIVWP